MQQNLSPKYVVKTVLIAVLAALLSSIFLDQILCAFFQNDLEPYMTVRKVARELTDLGYSAKYFIIAVLMMLAAMMIRRFFSKPYPHTKTIFDWGAKLFLSMLASGIVIHVFKFLIGRGRPHVSADFNPFIFHPMMTDPHYNSLPSGHSQTIFVLVAILCLFLHKESQKNLRLCILLAGAVLAFTRVVTHQHFLSDCILGATIGFLVTVKMCEWYDRKTAQPSLDSKKSVTN